MISIHVVRDDVIVEPRANTQFIFRCAEHCASLDSLEPFLNTLWWPVTTYEFRCFDAGCDWLWVNTRDWPSEAHLQLVVRLCVRVMPRLRRIHFPLAFIGLHVWHDRWKPWLAQMHAESAARSLEWSIDLVDPSADVALAAVLALHDWFRIHRTYVRVLVDASMLKEHLPVCMYLYDRDTRTSFGAQPSQPREEITTYHQDARTNHYVYGHESGIVTASRHGFDRVRFHDGDAAIVFLHLECMYPIRVWCGNADGRVSYWTEDQGEMTRVTQASFSCATPSMSIVDILDQGLVLYNAAKDELLVTPRTEGHPSNRVAIRGDDQVFTVRGCDVLVITASDTKQSTILLQNHRLTTSGAFNGMNELIPANRNITRADAVVSS